MKVYTSPDLPMVGHMKNILESHGISCTIQNQFSVAAVGEIPVNECWPELWVIDSKQIEKAKQIVNEAMAPDSTQFLPWECALCHETIEGQFTACWNCGTEKDDQSTNLL